MQSGKDRVLRDLLERVEQRRLLEVDLQKEAEKMAEEEAQRELEREYQQILAEEARQAMMSYLP